uniref:REM-1 domain-containing protein n=1 Tax=Gopherus agassizii TaxID=38772 RepID=A0A452GL05_9SAUR
MSVPSNCSLSLTAPWGHLSVIQPLGPVAAGKEQQGRGPGLAFQARKKIDFEIRMREGICKLLAVSTQKDQVLHAVKNLMVCNARILAYKTELQKQKEEPVRYRTGGGMLDFIELKPLTLCYITSRLKRFFGSSTGSQRYAIFCLFKMGAEVFDTDMVIVDKAITDICFENVTIFDEAGPDFQVKFEVYSCCTDQSSPITNTPKKLAKKLKTSIGKATGKKINSLLEEDNLESFSFIDPIIPGAKYSLLAHTTLGLESAEDNFRTHNLIVTGNEESSFWLPLYGSMCCRLVAQPFCMAKDVMSGFLNQQETRIRAVDRGTEKRINNFTVTNPVDGEAVTQLFAADSREELHKWMEAFWQHFYDLSQWKHCCEEFMKIEIMSPRKPPLFLTKEATSVYHDISKWDLSFQAAGTDQLDKENLWKKPTIARRTSSSFDAKLSSMMHQLQRPIAAPRKLVPCRKISSIDSENPLSSVTETESETKPVPAPRQKSIKEILDPGSWLQSQV